MGISGLIFCSKFVVKKGFDLISIFFSFGINGGLIGSCSLVWILCFFFFCIIIIISIIWFSWVLEFLKAK